MLFNKKFTKPERNKEKKDIHLKVWGGGKALWGKKASTSAPSLFPLKENQPSPCDDKWHKGDKESSPHILVSNDFM